MGISLIYPTIYDFTQLKKQGFTEYFSDIWNYFDQCHIWIGYGNIVIQALNQDQPERNAAGDLVYRANSIGIVQVAYTPNEDYYKPKKVIIIIVTAVMLLKTFFFLRLFESLSHLVLMMRQVVKDLKAFLIFYTILLWICGLVFSIIELGDLDQLKSDEKGASKLKLKTYPGVEYQYIPKFLRHFITLFRMSLGDFDFGESTSLDPFDNHWFWVTWSISVIVTMVVFLNFIIAEVGNSYNIVNEKIQGLIEKERSILIEEAEDMMLTKWKTNANLFPKYLIMREVEE